MMTQDFSIVLSLLKIPYAFLALTSFSIAFIISFYVYPVIIHVAHEKQLIDEPGERSVHQKGVPTLGGVGIFIGVCIALSFLGFALHSKQLVSLFGSLIMLFFMGIKDGILVLSPRKKIMIQLAAAFHVILIADVRITNFFGLFDIYELSYLASTLFSLFIFILIINAYNLIDGVDGLAGSIGLLTSLFFVLFFLLNDMQSIGLISLALAGALCSFLFYNFSSKNKIFMGDTGSMLVGFLLAFQAILFLKNQATIPEYQVINSPVFVFAILSFPLVDTLRVFSIRLLKGESPFKADKNHIHHQLILLGFKHWQIAIITVVFTLTVLCVAFVSRNLNINWQFPLVFTCAILLILSPYFMTIKSNRIKLFKPRNLLK